MQPQRANNSCCGSCCANTLAGGVFVVYGGVKLTKAALRAMRDCAINSAKCTGEALSSAWDEGRLIVVLSGGRLVSALSRMGQSVSGVPIAIKEAWRSGRGEAALVRTEAIERSRPLLVPIRGDLYDASVAATYEFDLLVRLLVQKCVQAFKAVDQGIDTAILMGSDAAVQAYLEGKVLVDSADVLRTLFRAVIEACIEALKGAGEEVECLAVALHDKAEGVIDRFRISMGEAWQDVRLGFESGKQEALMGFDEAQIKAEAFAGFSKTLSKAVGQAVVMALTSFVNEQEVVMQLGAEKAEKIWPIIRHYLTALVEDAQEVFVSASNEVKCAYAHGHIWGVKGAHYGKEIGAIFIDCIYSTLQEAVVMKNVVSSTYRRVIKEPFERRVLPRLRRMNAARRERFRAISDAAERAFANLQARFA